jgi:hypothetical protein
MITYSIAIAAEKSRDNHVDVTMCVFNFGALRAFQLRYTPHSNVTAPDWMLENVIDL